MGEAVLAAILDRKLARTEEIILSDVNEARRRHLIEKYGVLTTADNRLIAKSGDIIVLAIKPQTLEGVMAELRGSLKETQLVVSIIAGAAIDALRRGLGHNRIVRVMPNTPARIGEGISVWTATPEVTQKQKEQAGEIIRVMGEEIYVNDEKYLDMATAVSGSGPAYFFFFVEALTAAAVDIGLPDAIAKRLVLQTMLGSGHLLQKSEGTAAELRKMVTSPGGTTEAAINTLEQADFKAMVKKAVEAAHRRARELGKQDK